MRARYAQLGEYLRQHGGSLIDAWLCSGEPVVIQADGRIVMLNAACAQLFGFADPRDVLGQPLLDIEPGAERGCFEDQARSLPSAPKAPVLAVHRIQRADGTEIDVEARSVSFVSGERTFAMSILRDVTAQVRAQAQIERNEAALRDAQRLAKLGSWELDHVSGELAWSDEIFRIFEIDPREFRASYQAFLDLVHPADRMLVDQAFARSVEAHEPYSVEHRLLLADGRVKYVHERGLTYYDAQGKPLRSMGTVQDISARVAADRALAEREQLLQTIVDASPDWIFAKDHEFRFLMVNRAMAEAIGYEKAELIGRHDTDFWPVDECEPSERSHGFHADDAAAMQGRTVRVAREEASTSRGSVVLNTVKGPLRDVTGKIIGAYGYARDITEADRMQRALRDSEARLSLIFNTTQDLLVLLSLERDSAVRVLAANQAAVKEFGGPSASSENKDLVGLPFEALLRSLLNDGDFERCMDEHRWAIESLSARTYSFISSALSDRHFEVTITPVAGALGRASFLLWAARDTTERARAEAALRASESRYRAVVEDQTEMVARFRADGSLLFVNDAGCRFVGMSREQLLSDSFVPFIVKEDLPKVEACLSALSPSAPVGTVEHRVALQNGDVRWTRWTNRAFFDRSGKLVEMQSVGQDITEQHLAARRIVAQLEEKEVLLREVHHRVKNNLQVVSSLLFLQRQRSKSPEFHELLRDSEARVAAMALIHERLFGGSNLTCVDMRSYTRELGISLMSTYATARERIQLEVKGTPFLLPLDRATPYALILNEIITNALKHGFVHERAGKIFVEFEDGHEAWSLIVGDDGIGAPHNVLTAQTSSLGVRLMLRLVEQLEARIDRLDLPGTFYRISGQRELRK